MPNIQGQKKWSEVRLLELHELARGGITGNMNEQAIALADRTEFLNQEKASKSEIVQGVFEFGTYAEFNSAKATLPLNCTVVIGEENKTGFGQWGIGNNRWNGTSLTKSSYDAFFLSKKFTEEKFNLAAENDLGFLLAIQNVLNAVMALKDSSDIDITYLKNEISKQLTENNSMISVSNNILLGLYQVVDSVSQLQNYTDERLLLSSIENQNIATNLFMGISTIAIAINENRDDLDQAIESIKNNEKNSLNLYLAIHSIIEAVSTLSVDLTESLPTESQKLQTLMLEHEKTIEFLKLDGFDPEKAGSNKYVYSESVAVFPAPDEIIRIDIQTESNLPTAKGTVIKTINTVNVSGSVLSCFGTLEVQGSSSANFPKKNWTLGFFNNESREDAIKVKLGHLMPHDELVFKANFVDNTHCRNIAVNRIWDQMQMSRSGWPKREPDFVNMKNGVGLSAQPTGATGHVDGFPAVMYVNNQFYGLGCLNIGKKRDNYNLKKDDPKHIQLDPEGSVNLYSLPATPYDPANSGLTTAAFDVRRPATWQEQSQAYYDRLSAFLKMSKSGMETAGIDNYIDRKSMMDYIILCQVSDLWDHLHKNTLYTTWDGNIWHFLPYDVDTVFGLHFTGVYYNSDGVTELHPANKLIVPSTAANSSWGTLAKFRLIYGAEIDARYADLRRKNIISIENILHVCESLTRKFPTALFEAENTRWNLVPGGTIYQTLQQTGSTKQIYDWLSIRLPLCDSYFNFSS